MGRTTPPPPLDITAVFPELEPLARRTVRLHPRAGAPGSGDSSLGGPLRWPAGEPWPTCQQPHDRLERIPMPPEILLPEAPSPLVGVLQLYARDVPDLPFPEHTDLFQLLWCPNDHGEPWWGPCPITVWRQAAEVTEPLATPPSPRFDDDWSARNHVPLPCGLSPEPVIEYPDPCPVPAEYPHRCNWPAELAERIQQWDEQHDGLYWAALSVAPGSKVGGYPSWIQAPEWPVCACGRQMDHLLTIASDEFGSEGRWLPLEDREGPTITSERRRIGDRDAWAPHGLMLGDVGSLYLFTCTACPNRPLAGTMQCS